MRVGAFAPKQVKMACLWKGLKLGRNVPLGYIFFLNILKI